jgi:hypothetical protein
MGEEVLDEILIGKFQDDPEVQPIEKINPIFKVSCPLWIYCLAETAHHTVNGHTGVKSKLLGPVGGRIVAETFAGLLMYDSQSFISQDSKCTPNFGGKSGEFGLRDFVRFALGQ